MKRCPKCRRDYYDDSLLYCLEDGAALVSGVPDDPVTAILSGDRTSGEAATRTFDADPTTGTSAEGRRSRITSTRNSVIVGVVGIALVTALGVGGYLYYGRGSGKQIDSIAVMPFINESGNADLDYLSDGMTDTLISSLSKLPNLSVKARSSVFRYKGQERDAPTIGRELNVQAVLNGRVVQRGEQLTLNLELVDVRTENLIWSEKYDRLASDLVSLQNEVAYDVSRKLRARLSGTDEEKLGKTYTADPEAYEAYLKGRFYWNKRTKDGIGKSIEFFQQAVDKDPNYALGYVGLADSYAVLENYTGHGSSEALTKAKSAANRALQIDDSLAEAHASLGNIDQRLWLWDESDREFRRSIELDPKYATARHWYSLSLKVKRQFDDALREIRVAQELDPLSSVIGHNVGVAYFLKGDFGSAEQQFRKVIELDPAFPLAHQYLGWTHIKQGRIEEGTAEIEKAVQLSRNSSRAEAELGYCYAIGGRRNDALQMLGELELKYKAKEATAVSMSVIYAGLGDKDQAFAWLEKAFEERNGELSDITWRPVFDTLRDDRRYTDLVRRMKLDI